MQVSKCLKYKKHSSGMHVSCFSGECVLQSLQLEAIKTIIISRYKNEIVIIFLY